MPRIARKNFLSKYFHIMVQGINREHIFEKDEFKEKYMKYLKKYLENAYIELIAYCAMNNHVHILVYTENVDDISKMMASINTKYAKYYNNSMGRCGYVFRDRFKSQTIKDQGHLQSCIRYIHNNPVKARICQEPFEYKFSSYNDYANNKVHNNILKLLFKDLGINNVGILLHGNVEYDFIDVKEDIKERPIDVLKEYQEYDYMNQMGIYKIIIDLRKRCSMKNDEIADLLRIKRSTFYYILKKYKK